MEQDTVTVQNIEPHWIDPKSRVNVRRLAKENVERLERVMRKIGFLPEHPIMVRPHPDSESEFAYEVVAGQCRAAAARAAGLESIPAIVETLEDDEAKLRSWHENEHREDLKPSEKAEWTKFFYEKHFGDGATSAQAMQAAADALGIEVQTARKYWFLGGSTDKVKALMDSGDLKIGPARAIVEGTRMGEGYEEDEARIDERVDWYQGLSKDDRALALDAIKEERKEATIEALEAHVETHRESALGKIQVELARDDREALMAYGRELGLTDMRQILGFVVAQALGERRAA